MAPGFVIDGAVRNAAASWVLVAIIAGIAVGAVLAGQALYAAFAVAVVVLAAVPPVRFGPRAMLPWEVLALCALPLFARAGAVRLLTTGGAASVATYLSVAAVALVVAVELDVFTDVRLANWFGVLFVAVATMAAAGFLALFGWWFDLTVGATFVLPAEPPLTAAEERAAVAALVRDFAAATVAGVAAGGVFAAYFRRYPEIELRLPPELEAVFE